MCLTDSKLKNSRTRDRPPIASPELSSTPKAKNSSSEQLSAPDEMSLNVTASTPIPDQVGQHTKIIFSLRLGHFLFHRAMSGMIQGDNHNPKPQTSSL